MGALKVGSLFSGVGGLDLAVEQFFDAETVWHCEWDEEPSKVLAARWPGVPNHRDVTQVDWSAVEPVDILCGGFPCQDLSLAGRRAGMRPGTRSGLWADFLRAIDVLRPKVVVIENVRGLLSGCAESASDGSLGQCERCVDPDGKAEHVPNVRALGRVLGDLSVLGFDAEWHGLLASDIGAPHGRFRVFVLAYAQGERFERGWPTWERGAGPANRGGGRNGASLTLIPDAAAGSFNESESIEAWLERRARVKHETGNGNGFGMPLGVAVRLLPTPQVADMQGGHASRSGDRSGELLLPGLAVAAHAGRLLPTPRASRGASGTETMYALGAERNDTGDRQGNVTGQVAWGEYAPAVRLWEDLTRPAPAPTLPDGKNGNHRLAAVFPEWMMGYPAGWVTDILGRNPAIKACGNGVIPQQAFAALNVMWPHVLREVAV